MTKCFKNIFKKESVCARWTHKYSNFIQFAKIWSILKNWKNPYLVPSISSVYLRKNRRYYEHLYLFFITKIQMKTFFFIYNQNTLKCKEFIKWNTLNYINRAWIWWPIASVWRQLSQMENFFLIVGKISKFFLIDLTFSKMVLLTSILL